MGGSEVLYDNPANITSKPTYPTGYREESMMYLTFTERSVFFAVFLFIFVVALLGNIAAIYATVNRKHRCIQKTLIISLASSDLIMATAYTINYLETFSHHLVNWTLGSFMCRAIPFFQIFGVIASSGALVAIALDRYRNVVHVTKQKWNPSFLRCMCGISIMWIISAAMSVPIAKLFDHKRALIVFYEDSKPVSRYIYMCLSFEKENLKIYYICVASVIFMPLLVIFSWLYYNIAKLVWSHRKPFSHKFQKKQETSIETVTSQLKTDDSVTTLKLFPKPPVPKQKNVSVKRKIRTFKLIILLVLAFFLCRVPYWTFNIMKLVNAYIDHIHWILTYVFNGLGLLNCALNPFLYTFLNETVEQLAKATKILNDFVCQVCCCCCSNTEFKEFEKENPFIENCQTSPKVEKNFKVRFDKHDKRY